MQSAKPDDIGFANQWGLSRKVRSLHARVSEQTFMTCDFSIYSPL